MLMGGPHKRRGYMSNQVFVPNQWRVLTVNENGVDLDNKFYVFKNQPSAQFFTDVNGNRVVYSDRDSAERDVELLNRPL